jgi:DNA adenine methylase
MSHDATGYTNGSSAPATFAPVPDISPRARPFVKMAGGKTKLLPELLKRVPKKFGSYCEPFVGGGAFFFELRGTFGTSKRYFLGDTNSDLIHAYREIRDRPHDLLRRLRGMKNNEAFFKKIRAWNPDALDPATDGLASARAARMIYLNKTCFNGLHRVNRKGEFNVPFGHYANPKIADKENILACSKALQRVAVSDAPFAVTSEDAKPGDLVYFDPPYLPLSETSNFTAYGAPFLWAQHVALYEHAKKLKARGVHVLLSNSASPRIVKLYGEDRAFKVDVIAAARSINSHGDKRGKIQELIIS